VVGVFWWVGEGGGGRGEGGREYTRRWIWGIYAKLKGRGVVIFGVVVERSEEILDSG